MALTDVGGQAAREAGEVLLAVVAEHVKAHEERREERQQPQPGHAAHLTSLAALKFPPRLAGALSCGRKILQWFRQQWPKGSQSEENDSQVDTMRSVYNARRTSGITLSGREITHDAPLDDARYRRQFGIPTVTELLCTALHKHEPAPALTNAVGLYRYALENQYQNNSN